jgi:hypothetical protein
VINGFQSLLPALDSRIGREPQFKEDEFAFWFQDAPEFLNRLHNARNSTQGEGANNCVNTLIFQWDGLTRQIKKFDIQGDPMPLLLSKLDHPRVRFKRIKLADSPGIVMNEIGARTCADLKNLALGQRDDLLADLFDGWRITQSIYKEGIDMISIERHEVSSVHAAITVDELLLRSKRRMMAFVCTVYQVKAAAEFAVQALRVIAYNIQPAAVTWSIRSKCGDNDMSTRPDSMSYGVYVALAVSGLRQEVEHSPIMPEVVGLPNLPL